MRRGLQQILIRLILFRRLCFRLLNRLSLRGTRLLIRLLRYARLRFRLLYRLALRPLLLLLSLLLCLTLTLQRLLALCRRLFIPRHFVKLGGLLAHIGLHLCQ